MVWYVWSVDVGRSWCPESQSRLWEQDKVNDCRGMMGFLFFFSMAVAWCWEDIGVWLCECSCLPQLFVASYTSSQTETDKQIDGVGSFVPLLVNDELI